jgi:hypothetical protein
MTNVPDNYHFVSRYAVSVTDRDQSIDVAVLDNVYFIGAW